MKASSSISGGRRHRKSRLYAAASDWERLGRLLTYLGAACGTFLLRMRRFAIEYAVWVDASMRIVQNQSIVAIHEYLHATSTVSTADSSIHHNTKATSTRDRMPGLIETFLEDLETMHPRLRQSHLQTILKTAHISRDTIELEFRV